MLSIRKYIKDNSGDTIVEVLIAIAIAAFAIGITYATAQHSLQTSITAKEHNEALNIVENQISDLQLRFQNSDAGLFNSQFSSATHFCLDDTATTASAASPWIPISNPGAPGDSSPLTAPNPYDTHCTKPSTGNGFNYYTDIVKVSSSAAPAGDKNPVTYQVIVRWEPVGGGQTNRVNEYYRVDGGTSKTLGAVVTVPGPPAPAPSPSPGGSNPTGVSAFSQTPGGAGGKCVIGKDPSNPKCIFFSKTFTNKSQQTDPSISIKGCQWSWGDGTNNAVNTACNPKDTIPHTFNYPYSKTNPPCVIKYTVTLTEYLSNNAKPSYSDYIWIPRGDGAIGLPVCP